MNIISFLHSILFTIISDFSCFKCLLQLYTNNIRLIRLNFVVFILILYSINYIQMLKIHYYNIIFILKHSIFPLKTSNIAIFEFSLIMLAGSLFSSKTNICWHNPYSVPFLCLKENENVIFYIYMPHRMLVPKYLRIIKANLVCSIN